MDRSISDTVGSGDNKLSCLMKTNVRGALFLTCVLGWIALPAQAADRVRAGQWDTTVDVAGRTMTKSACMSQSDADAINGDVKSVKAYVEKVTAPAGCKVTDVKINGNQVIVTSVCAAGKESVGTTTYHGDSFEAVNTNGAKAQAKWVGACK
jgi:hypothetical protein